METSTAARKIDERPPARARGTVTRALLIAAGSLFVALAVLGIFLPLLPTTPFLLVAAACYGRSSPGAYRWLTTNRWFGSYLREYREERGITARNKAVSITAIWLGIGLSAYLLSNLFVTVPMVLVACAVTVYLLRMRTLRRS